MDSVFGPGFDSLLLHYQKKKKKKNWLSVFLGLYTFLQYNRYKYMIYL